MNGFNIQVMNDAWYVIYSRYSMAAMGDRQQALP